ncbi:ABC transporter ATP-binding protein [Vallitaleaceae bacterium 9-2]
MYRFFQEKYALSYEGSKQLVRAILWTALLNLSFFAPAILGFAFLEDAIMVIQNNEDPQMMRSIGFYVAFALIAFGVMFVIAYIQYHTTFSTTYEESAKMRINLAETLKKLPLAFFGKKDIADLSSTIMEDATQVETMFSHNVPQIYASAITIVLAGISLMMYQWKMAVAMLWVIPVALIVFTLSKKFQESVHQKLYDHKRTISDLLQESLDSAQEIKSYNREGHFKSRMVRSLDKLEELLIHGELLLGAFINMSYVVLKLGLPSVVLVGIYLLSTKEISTFTFIVFLVVASRIYNPIIEALNNFAALLFLQVRIDRMKSMLKMPRQEGIAEFYPKHFDIEFKKVSFGYDEEQTVLDEISFTAKQGEVTALIGPSGGGKSTVAKLAARFWDIDKGRITLGGQDISKIDPETLLSNYSIVFQDVTLFNSSIMENIRLGRKDASDAQVIEAARLARCEEFIEKFPQGYDTHVGENGDKLSGGERQRISIARAILKDAPIILLDEATASLDAENETKIQEALGELIKEKTVIIIAHRMRTVIGADKIVVLKEGKIAEMGHPQALRERPSIFAKMLKAQLQQ